MANEIEVRVTGTDATGTATASADRNLRKVGTATAATGREMDTAAKKTAGWKMALGDIGKVAGGVLLADQLQNAARKAVDFAKSTVSAASNLNESVNAVQKIFDNNSDQILKWGQNNAAAFGLSTRAFNEMATPMGAILKNTGMSMSDVADNTIALTKRAADLASVFNTTVPDALAAIQAGLRGEQDPLERYGVSLSAVAVEQQALADTGKASAMALTTQEKAAARLKIIFQQTADAEGDFAGTSTGLANAQRIATAEIENMKAKVGVAFTPVMATAAQITGNFAGIVGALPGPALVAVAAIGGLAAAFLVAVPRIVATRKALEEFTSSSSRTVQVATKVGIGIGKVGAGFLALQAGSAMVTSALNAKLNPQLDALVVGLQRWADHGELAGESARILGKDAQDLNDALSQVTDNAFLKGFAGAMEDISFGTVHSFHDATDRVAAFDAALKQLVENGHAREAGDLVALMADKSGISLDKVRAALPGYTSAIEVAANGTKKLAVAANTAAVDVDALSKSMDAIIGATFGLEAAQDKAANAVADLRDQIKGQKDAHDKGAGSVDRSTQAGRDNAAALRDLVSTYKDLMVEYQEAGLSTDGLARSLENQLVAMGMSRKEAQRYTGQIALLQEQLAQIPATTPVNIKVIVEGAREAERELNRLRIGARIDPPFIDPVAPKVDRPSYTGHAAGGISGGGWATLNEQGPEIVHLPNGSQVYPAGTSRTMMSGGGPGRLDVAVTVDTAGSHELVAALVRMLRYDISVNGGGNVQRHLGR